MRQMVRSQTQTLKRDLSLTTEAGALKENIKKNRYKDILPYDQSRVLLSLLTTKSDSDYINASFIKVTTYIASQGPLSSTVIDFWRMIWQHDVKKKCECYWAPFHQSAAFGPFTVSNVRRNTNVLFDTSRSLIQYQFLSWPDHDIPYEATGVLDLLERARNSQGTHTSPVLIHCSAGCGRTGVICALDYIHDLLVTKQITSDFSIKKIVLELRRQRPAAVQTKVGDSHPNNLTHLQQTQPTLLQSLPLATHYDNASAGASAAPVYSTVKPRIKPHSLKVSATSLYDNTILSSHSPGEGAPSGINRDQKCPHQRFNCRIQKPRGPRDPPAEWSHLER
uniref:protein-tyrosine-phosphatase n=1 Tax=Anabas testudineus TaxID=64144 RepID=A0A7N6BMN0_ANATE